MEYLPASEGEVCPQSIGAGRKGAQRHVAGAQWLGPKSLRPTGLGIKACGQNNQCGGPLVVRFPTKDDQFTDPVPLQVGVEELEDLLALAEDCLRFDLDPPAQVIQAEQTVLLAQQGVGRPVNGDTEHCHHLSLGLLLPDHLVGVVVALDDVEGGGGNGGIGAVGADKDLCLAVSVEVSGDEAGLANARAQVVEGPD